MAKVSDITHSYSVLIFVALSKLFWDAGRGTYYHYYRSPSCLNSHSFLRMFMTYDFAPAFISNRGHIVVSYLALAQMHVCQPFFGKVVSHRAEANESSRKALM